MNIGLKFTEFEWRDISISKEKIDVIIIQKRIIEQPVTEVARLFITLATEKI